jgi:Ran GTPase-activating protein (RanGAP) involved in mRNA processing and transport
VKILFKNVVRLETKGDKTENRVLVFSPCRILLLTAKVPTKIDCHFHYLEIQALESKRGNQLSLTINDKVYSFLTGDDSTCSAEVDNMISALNNAIRNIFPTVPLQHIIKKIDVIPNTRLQQLRDLEAIASSRREVGPCGGFSTQYACMCDYHGMTYREEVAWDVDNIYVSLNTRELCLKDFDYLDQKDLIPIISALEYNTWFTKLRANQVRLSHDNIERIFHVLRKSLNLEEIYLDNLGLKADFVNKLGTVLKLNPATALHTVDLSYNTIEDKAHCGLSSKGVNHLAAALNSNSSMLTTLTYLNLSGNSLKDDISNLHTFLTHSNALQHVDISGTDVILESLFGALVRGCTTNLVHLNISRNPFSSKKSKEAPISFKKFFSTTLNLKYLNMSHCKLPQEALKNLLLGLACNEYTKEMSLDISNNGLGSQGAHVLESCVHGVRCISSLDISDNNMDGDLANVVLAISKNKSLRHLQMGRSMKKHMSTIMDSIVHILQDDECLLQSLFIPDCRLRSDTFNLLNALGDNKSLETLDISGNLIGDSGARLMAKALQINNKLKTIIFDRNNVTLLGYNDIAYALESNRTLHYIPFPIYDVAPCMKANAERTDAIMRKIQDLLNRNVTLRRNSLKSFPLQPGFLLTSKQQALERLVAQTQEAIKNYSAVDSITSHNDINHATGVIQDAENSKQLLVRLQEVAKHRDDGHPVEAKLQQAACDVHTSICDYLQITTDKMLKCCKEQCPYILHDEQTVQEIKKGCKNKKQIPLDFVTTCIKQQAGVDIMNRVRELNLIVAAQLSEQITDEVYEALMRSYKILVGDASAIRIDSPPRRSRLSSSGSSRHGTSDISITDSTHQSDHSPLATPHLSIKRKSLHGRKLRPKSVVDSVEGLSADDIPSLLPSSNRNSEEDDSVTELPSATHQLQHLVKGRPRRAKTRAPTRPLVKHPDVSDPVSQDLVEGLETFFRPGSVTPTSDDCNSFQADGSPNHDYASPVLSDDRKTPKMSRNSPLLRGLMTPTPRSRSTDNLEKFSPSFGRRHANDCASPLTRRFTGESVTSHESSDGSIAGEVNMEGEAGEHDSSRHFKMMSGPLIAPKPRPWSMVNSEAKSADLLSDGSSPINSTGNTPDSADTLDSSESSLEKRVTKDVKLKRGGILERGDTKFLQRYKATSDKPGRPSDDVVRRRDSNYNCSETEDAHISR